MICTKEIKIDKTENITADYIENKLKSLNLDVLRWAITNIDENQYTLDVAVVENQSSILTDKPVITS